jgi:hypothetical protein
MRGGVLHPRLESAPSRALLEHRCFGAQSRARSWVPRRAVIASTTESDAGAPPPGLDARLRRAAQASHPIPGDAMDGFVDIRPNHTQE